MAKHAGMRLLAAADFALATPPPPLAADAIHVWYFRSVAKAGHSTLLTRLLAGYLGIPHAHLVIERDGYGKPHLTGPHAASMQFNLSHSGSSLIVALSRNQAVGVDIEDGLRDRPWLALAERYFAPAEYERLARLPEADLAERFIALWSCKEAVLKALGRGIAFGLHRLRFEWDAGGQLARLAGIDAEAGPAAEWRVVRLAPAAGVAGALAWRGPDRPLLAFVADTGDPVDEH